MKRFFDLAVASALLVATLPLFVAVAFAIKATSSGPVLFRTQRVGKDNCLFTMLKFRTMRVDTPQLATHLLENPGLHLTAVGGFLRRTSLDELPQLINVLRGDMSMVGPRPALFNQHDLVALRTQSGVHVLVPGITGWAQINGRDELPVAEKVRLDGEYLAQRRFLLDLLILFRTLGKALCASGVSH